VSALDLTTASGLVRALLPEVTLTVWSLVVLLVVAWRHRTEGDARLAGWLSFIGLLTAGAAQLWLWLAGAAPAGLPQMVALDTFRFAGNGIILLMAAVTVLLSLGYLERERMAVPEYYPLILLATTGMMFLAGAEDLIVVFLGLEVMSVAVYVLAGFDRRSIFSAEAALKYFLIGAFASGFLLYGIALVYGATGNTNLTLIGAQLATGTAPLMGRIGLKAAGFLALVRVLMEAFPSLMSQWQPVIAVLAIATMIAGNLIALNQRNLKRMLAYSSVAHAGYLLTAVWAGTRFGAGAVLLYLLAYGLTTIAAFGILATLGSGGERTVGNDDIAGLADRRPWSALALSICMLSLFGFPGTFGFIGKWYILQAVVHQRQVILPVVLVLTSVISAGYYLPVVMAMYMKPGRAESEAAASGRFGRFAAAAVAASVAAVILFGLWPAPAIDGVLRSGAALVESAPPIAAGE